MSSFKKGIYLALTGGFLAAVIASVAYPQGAVTLVQLVLGGTAVSTSNPLPVTVSGGSGGAVVVQGNVSDATSGVAPTSTNVPAVSYNYVWNGATWDQAGGLVIGAAGTAATQVVTMQGITGMTPVVIQGASTGGGFPTAATAITASATGTTAATAATLAAASSKTTYICGFSIDSDATVGLGGASATIVGIISGTMTFIQGVGVAPAVATTSKTFNPCIPSSTTNTAIVVTSAAASTGGNTSVNAWGYQQ